MFDLIHPNARPGLPGAFAAFLERPGAVVTSEHRVRHREGSWRWVEAVGKNLLGDRVIAGIVVNYRDVTERKRLDEQLRQTQKLESIGVLAGGVAHDFNNLLTGVLGNATLALDVLGPEHAGRSHVEDVIKAGESAAHLTRQLLAYSGKGRFVMQPVDLSDLTREMTTLVRTSIPRTVELRLDLAADLPAVEGDRGQLQQLIMNLAINGAESIPEDKPGSVAVATSVRSIDEESTRGAAAGAEIQPGVYVAPEVRDTGCGWTRKPNRRSSILSSPPSFPAAVWVFPRCWASCGDTRGRSTSAARPDRAPRFKCCCRPARARPPKPAHRRAARISAARARF